MNAPARRRGNAANVTGRAARVLAALCALSAVACGSTFYEVPIETPIQPKLDVTPFQRVLVAGFVTGGTEEVDANQETARLLKSSLRSKSSLRVIDADVMPLAEIARNQSRPAAATDAPTTVRTSTSPDQNNAQNSAPNDAALALPVPIKDEKDIEPYGRLFANTAYWKQIGEEYQNPLIVTGTVLFMENSSQSIQTRQNERLDAFGQRTTTDERIFQDRKGFVLVQKFVFIDGRTGATMYTDTKTERIVYPAQQNMPALASYFELMEKLVPNFLTALSSQKIRGTRVLLQ